MTLLSGLEPCDGLGFDIAQPIWSESVALFVVTPDADRVVSLRLCRYPDAGTCWVWAHVVGPSGAWCHAVDHVPCGRDRVAVGGADVTYAADSGVPVCFQREGSRDAPDRASVDVVVDAHPGLEAPDLPGGVPVRVTGEFRPTTASGGTLPGRTELFGEADLVVSAEGHESFTVSGQAQWHEQHQDQPRFVVPFTYASLRGPELALVALIAPRASGGFSRGVDGDRQHVEARIPEPVDGRHPLELRAADGTTLQGDVTVRRTLRLRIYGRSWWGTIVTGSVGGHTVTGSVNRWRPGPA